jgi:hypothetical protein
MRMVTTATKWAVRARNLAGTSTSSAVQNPMAAVWCWQGVARLYIAWGASMAVESPVCADC